MNSLAAPPALAYRYLEEAKEAVFSHALSEGYAFVVLHTRRVGNKKDGAIKVLILNCSKGRHTRKEQNPDKKRVRVGTIKATGCLFAASIRLEDELWQMEVENREHNHEPNVHVSAHPHGTTVDRGTECRGFDFRTRWGDSWAHHHFAAAK